MQDKLALSRSLRSNAIKDLSNEAAAPQRFGVLS